MHKPRAALENPAHPCSQEQRTNWYENPLRSQLLAPFTARIDFALWPGVDVYNNFLPADTRTRSGKPVRFVTEQSLGDALNYEQRVYETGVIATRERNWHDLFNALVWSMFPQAKAAINARHVDELHRGSACANQRTRVRDALTLLDESGVIVASDAPHLLEALRAMRWKELFWRHRGEVQALMRFFLFGHGLCEQALRPFIGLTGKALLIAVPTSFLGESEAQQLRELDARIAACCDEAALAPGRLHPLPLLGVPGWWPDNEHESFYENSSYFRSQRARHAT